MLIHDEGAPVSKAAITIRNWQFLRSLANHGSVSGAARHEHHSDSVVRRNIKALANACAVEIIRTEEGVTRVTEAGQELLDRFALIEHEFDMVSERLHELVTLTEEDLLRHPTRRHDVSYARP